jgi:two-component system cell cycle response regulator
MSDRVKELETLLDKATDPRTRIDLLNDLAWEVRDTDPNRSRDLSETAYQLTTSNTFEEQIYHRDIAMSLRGLAHSNRRAGNLSLSLSQSMQALDNLKSTALPGVEADILRNIAIILGSLGNYAEGLEYGFKALNLVRSIGDREREASILSSIGVIYVHSKNTDESLRTFRQALQLNHELGRKQEEALVLNNASLAHRALGDYDSALATSLEALRLAKETKFAALIVTATGTVGEAYLAMGKYSHASQYLQRYLDAARSTESKRDEVWALILLGETDHRRGSDTSAFSYITEALDIAEEVGLRMEKARCHELLAEMYEQQGNPKQALAQLKLFYKVKETIFNEDTAKRIANLQVIHQVETAKRDAEIHYLKTIELQREIEERKKAESALEKLATIDPLTEVLNRREFFVLAEREVQNALRREQALSAILLDVDHFKSINDNYGHSVGDQVLTAVARIVRDNLRKGEIVGRIGGDEFAILLPGSNWQQGQQVARRLQKKITSHSFKADPGIFSVTASLGIAELDGKRDISLGPLLDHADQAMYAAKRAGRNRIDNYQTV